MSATDLTSEEFDRLIKSINDDMPNFLASLPVRACQPTIHHPTIWSDLGDALFSAGRGLRNVARFALIAGTTAALITAERHRNER